MQANPKIGSMDAVLDKLYGKVGSPERSFAKHTLIVWGKLLVTRKQEKMTQSSWPKK